VPVRQPRPRPARPAARRAPGPGYSDDEIAAAIGLIWGERDDRYSELRALQPAGRETAERRVEMHYIGG
jgi:cyclic pyranopterin phosphate synthase